MIVELAKVVDKFVFQSENHFSKCLAILCSLVFPIRSSKCCSLNCFYVLTIKSLKSDVEVVIDLETF